MDELSGTKELVFDAFIELTSELGYENVNVRDIAKKIGISVASIYYHFKSKREIIEYAYDYYAERQYDNRKTLDEMKRIMETVSPHELVTTLFYTFVSDDQKKYIRMILITKIIYMRIFQDPIANKMFSESNRNNAEYVISVLKHGIDIGRVEPDFDLATFAGILIGAMENMGIKAFADVDYIVGQLEQEKHILALLARLLSTAMK